MIQKIIEVDGGGFNWGKFMLLKFDREWSYQSQIESDRPMPLLRCCGWTPDNIWVLDLQTGEGALFRPDAKASVKYDLGQKHRVWVCPMYEPFLQWLYRQDLSDITKLPVLVSFTADQIREHASLTGYRREGGQCEPSDEELEEYRREMARMEHGGE